MLVNVAPHLPGYPSPYPLLLYEDALLYLLARVLRLPFPGLRGQVEHQPVDRAAELRAAPHRQADDLAYALERVRNPVFTPEAESFVDPAGGAISVYGLWPAVHPDEPPYRLRMANPMRDTH